jgi:hypothetical protein
MAACLRACGLLDVQLTHTGGVVPDPHWQRGQGRGRSEGRRRRPMGPKCEAPRCDDWAAPNATAASETDPQRCGFRDGPTALQLPRQTHSAAAFGAVCSYQHMPRDQQRTAACEANSTAASETPDITNCGFRDAQHHPLRLLRQTNSQQAASRKAKRVDAPGSIHQPVGLSVRKEENS